MSLRFVGAEDGMPGSQICKIPLDALIARKCFPGSPAEVTVSGDTFVCLLHPHRFASNVIYVDKTVQLQRSDNAVRSAVDVNSDIRLLAKSELAVELSVTVVLESVRDLVRWHGLRRDRLRHWVSRILRNYHVKSGSTVYACHQKQPLSRLCCVHSVIVHDATPALDASACRATGATKITLSDVTYVSEPSSTTTSSRMWDQAMREPALVLKKLCTFPYKYPETLKSLGLRLQRGVLLTGPPGTGKTSIVRRVAQDCKAHLLVVRGPELCRSLPGESEALLRGIFEEAKIISDVLPCVVLIDDVDLLCAKRSSGAAQHANRLVTQLLTLMDGMDSRRRVFVVATTSRPNSIDPAMRRPGRFDKEVR